MTDSISGYNLESPTAEYAILTLASVLGEHDAQHLWKEACQHCGVSIGCTETSQLEIVFEHLSTKEGPVGVFGMSLKIRLQAHQNLSRLHQKASKK